MAKSKSQDALRKQKEARQKKMLIGLAPLLLLLLAWQGPGMLKAFQGAPPPPPPAPVNNGEGTTDPTAAAPTTAGGAPPAAGAPAGGPATLPDTDDPDAAAQGQLVSFDRFVGKDPFKQHVSAKTSEEPVPAPGGPPTVTPPSLNPPSFEPPGSGGSPGDLPTSATVDVNGQRQEVLVGSTFPTIDPVFRIVSFGAKSAKFELVTGAFSTGSATITLKLKKPLTLVSQPDGLRYVITLVALGRNGG